MYLNSVIEKENSKEKFFECKNTFSYFNKSNRSETLNIKEKILNCIKNSKTFDNK